MIKASPDENPNTTNVLETFEPEASLVDLKQLQHFYDSWELDLDFSQSRNRAASSFVLFKMIRFLCRIPPPLVDRLVKERNRILSIAGQAFDHKNKFHSQCLFTIYTKLTGNILGGQRKFGSHWEEIGFQGSDPSTDFRGVGILGLLQLTFFIVTPQTQALSKDIYKLSLDERQFFPFAITGLNLTQLSLQILRQDLLNKYIIKFDSTLKAFNQFYFGLFHRFYQIWREGNKSIMDTGYVLRGLRGWKHCSIIDKIIYYLQISRIIRKRMCRR